MEHKTERHRFRPYEDGCIIDTEWGWHGVYLTKEELPKAIEILKKFLKKY